MKTRGTLIAACVLLVLGSGARGQFTPGHVFVADIDEKNCTFPAFAGGDRIWEIDPATGNVTLFVELTAEQCGLFSGLAFTPDGSRLRASLSRGQIVELDSEANLSVVLDGADGISQPSALTYDADGNLYVLVVGGEGALSAGLVLRFAQGGPPETVFANQQQGIFFSRLGDMAFAADGDLYVADILGNRVLRIAPAGSVFVFDEFVRAHAVTADRGGHVYVGTDLGEIFRYDAGDPGSKELLVDLRESTPFIFPTMTMSPDDSRIYVETVFKELFAVDPVDGTVTTVATLSEAFLTIEGIAVVPLTDNDGDGVFNTEDNCPSHANPDQADCDNDGTGDVCAIAECTGDPACADCDLNTKPDACDPDGDGDGTINACDACPTDPAKVSPGPCGCGTPDTDTDLDTIPDCNDRCPGEDDLLDENANGQPDCLEDIQIPTLSTWGVVIMAVLLLAVGRRVFGSGVGT